MLPVLNLQDLTSELSIAQVSTAERQELDQLLWTTSWSEVKPKLVAPRSSNNTVQCFVSILVLLLGSLSLHYGCCDVPWFKIATKVKEQLKELGDLEGQVRAREDAKYPQEVEEIASRKWGRKSSTGDGYRKRNLSGLVSSLLNQKSKSHRTTDKINNSIQKLEQLG